MDTVDVIFIIILIIIASVAGIFIELPAMPNDNIINQCNQLGYNTALKQSDTYYCADELIIEDSYRIGDDNEMD